MPVPRASERNSAAVADEAAARRAEGEARLAAAEGRMSVMSALRIAILSMMVR